MTVLGRLAFAAVILVGASVRAAVPEYHAEIVHIYPHDPAAFTEGLLYRDGFFFESTGLNGHSSIREVEVQTGKIVKQHDIGPKYFGEGIVDWKDHLIGLTYTTGIGFIFNIGDFSEISDFHYAGEGWGLTRDDSRIYMSDGTSDLRILEPDTMRQTGTIHVTCDGAPLKNLNELEWVKGEIYANVWLTHIIVRIDPGSGKVVGIVDLGDLLAIASANRAVDVLNGIAYDTAGDRLFVTGKLWPSLFQIRLSGHAQESIACPILK
ncbi:MAG TPA: glutamine cyclotransferase [Acetobacteraceae bacterium]|nr:glutamine cyclotransferase [Acetobacteraceae bacterium]